MKRHTCAAWSEPGPCPYCAACREASSATAPVEVVERLAGLLDDAGDWIRDNPPANGWGLLNRDAAREGDELRDRIRAALKDAKPYRRKP